MALLIQSDELSKLTKEFVELHRSNVRDGLTKSKKMGDLAIQIKALLEEREIPWHSYLADVGVPPATAYNDIAVAKNWQYIKRANVKSLRQAMNMLYPAEDMMKKYRKLVLDQMQFLYANCL